MLTTLLACLVNRCRNARDCSSSGLSASTFLNVVLRQMTKHTEHSIILQYQHYTVIPINILILVSWKHLSQIKCTGINLWLHNKQTILQSKILRKDRTGVCLVADQIKLYGSHIASCSMDSKCFQVSLYQKHIPQCCSCIRCKLWYQKLSNTDDQSNSTILVTCIDASYGYKFPEHVSCL